MPKGSFAWLVWGAAVALVYAALGVLAYVIGPAKSPLTEHSCAIVGTGSGRTTQGDSSAFRILAFTAPPTGSVLFTDEGPTSPLQFHDSHISTVTCSVNGGAGSVTGTADLRTGPSDIVGFRIDLKVSDGTGGPTTFRVRLTDGYDSGTETLRSADLSLTNHSVSRHSVVRE